jgi:hypothetical protein
VRPPESRVRVGLGKRGYLLLFWLLFSDCQSESKLVVFPRVVNLGTEQKGHAHVHPEREREKKGMVGESVSR